MQFARLARADRERLYIKKATELQIWWQNPIEGDWDFVSKMSDEDLEAGFRQSVGQLR